MIEELEEDLENFGTTVYQKQHKTIITEGQEYSSDQKENLISYIQWSSAGPRQFLAAGNTYKKLSPGYYLIESSQIGIIFRQVDINVDSLILSPDSISHRVIKEISNFWAKREIFKKYQFLHRRGYLFWGPQGSGKSCLIHQIISEIIKLDGIIFCCKNPSLFASGLNIFRQIEPDRDIIGLFEDIDGIIDHYGEDELLSILDGENQVDHILNLGTTNYPEKLDRRIVSRPRRFDRVIKIGMPTESQRRLFLTEKLIENKEIEKWISETKGLSFASLAELVVSTMCLGNNFEDTLKILKSMEKEKISSSKFNTQIGFGHSNGDEN